MPQNKAETIGLFITGALLGLTVGLLYAPESGVRTRKRIRKHARRGIEQLEDFQEDIRLQVDDWVEDVVDTLDEGLQRGRKLTLAGKEKALGIFDTAKHSVEDGRTRIDRMLRSRD